MSKTVLVAISSLILLISSCSKKSNNNLNPVAQQAQKSQENLAKEISTLPEIDPTDSSFIEAESGSAMGAFARNSLINKAREKRDEASLFRANEKIVKANEGHSKIYHFKGKYRIIVIPVQFNDVKFEDKEFFKTNSDGQSLAGEYIFGKNPNSMASYYKHASLGNLNLEGEVTPVITVDNSLKFYGEAVTGKSDRHANKLVVDALNKLKQIKTDEDWWNKYDTWDLGDYDKDENFHEPDGFIDAVVLIYAGKSQASCQSSFDTNGTRPPSADVPAGPRQAATLECYDRIWPHRWSLNINKNEPDYTEIGPLVEGIQRPAMNGLKINDNLFAVDYNMQSEFSDRSTFIHEFGHSLSLPDVYSAGEANSTGSWTVMSSNANLQAQEMSSYSKITLGWLAPKIIEQGSQTSAYLGAYNFVTDTQRETPRSYDGPEFDYNDESILSKVPDSGESVYRSIMVITDPSFEEVEIAPVTSANGSYTAHSGKFDSNTKTFKLNIDVPNSDDASLSFDILYHIETETNFNSKDKQIKVVTDFDLGKVLINSEIISEIRTISGDANFNTINESNPECNESEILDTRIKFIEGQLTSKQTEDYSKLVALCQKPTWQKQVIDLSKYKGQKIKFEISYTTDGGYTEFGILLDNIKLPDSSVIDFENEMNVSEFSALKNGKEILTYNQYYLMEHRQPTEDFISNSQIASYNMDKNIDVATQSMFIEEGSSIAERFRMVTFDYQPGVLVWYFNSKFGRNSSANMPVENKGKGYLLVLNSEVKELALPGVFSNSTFFNEDGTYVNTTNQKTALDELIKNQRSLYTCFAYTKYETYQTGKAPECEDDYKDYLKTLTFNGKKLVYSRELSNEVLPDARYDKFGVGYPFRTGATMRTGLSTFRPSTDSSYRPFKVFREENGEMVLDLELTTSSVKVAPVSKFDDANNELHPNPKFQGDSVVVEKKGFSFEVVEPSRQIRSRYFRDIDPDHNDSSLRAPRSKIYFSWK